MNQPSLFVETAHGWQAPPKPSAAPPIAGSTYDPQLDGQRLGEQGQAVFDLMKDGQWRTIAEIGLHVAGSQTGISARLRDLRKPEFGGHTVERRRMQSKVGVWEYRLIVKSGQ